MILIMVASPQLNCGRAPFTMAYTIASVADVFVYVVVICTYYIFFIFTLNLVVLSFCVFLYLSLYICVYLNIHLSTLNSKSNSKCCLAREQNMTEELFANDYIFFYLTSIINAIAIVVSH